MRKLVSEKEAEVVLRILMNTLDVGREQLTDDATLVDDLGADSLDVVEITMAVEEQLQLTVADEQSERVKTVGDLFELVGGTFGSGKSLEKDPSIVIDGRI